MNKPILVFIALASCKQPCEMVPATEKLVCVKGSVEQRAELECRPQFHNVGGLISTSCNWVPVTRNIDVCLEYKLIEIPTHNTCSGGGDEHPL